MMDKALQRQKTLERVKRHRALQKALQTGGKSVTKQGVTPKSVTKKEGSVTGETYQALCQRLGAPYTQELKPVNTKGERVSIGGVSFFKREWVPANQVAVKKEYRYSERVEPSSMAPAIIRAMADPVKRERLRLICASLSRRDLLSQVHYGAGDITFEEVQELLTAFD